MSPFESESRIAAQLAPLLTVELMPYFLKSPFSWAMTMGEQSARAMMPNFMSGCSGPSPAVATATGVLTASPQPESSAAPSPAAVALRKQRRSRAGDVRGRRGVGLMRISSLPRRRTLVGAHDHGGER